MKPPSFFIKLVASIFLLFFGVTCLITTVFVLAQNMTGKSNVKHYVENANIFDYSSRDIILDSQNTTLRQTVKSQLLTVDIPALVVDQVIDSKEMSTLISDYVYEYIQYILHDTTIPTFPSDGVLNILKAKYFEYEGKNLSAKQESEVLSYLKIIASKTDQSILDKNEVNEVFSLNIIKQITKVLSASYVSMGFIVLMIVLVLIISICLGSFVKAINWCSKMVMLNGVILIIASFLEVRILIMYFNSQGLIDSLIISFVENGFQNMLIYGIVLIVLGIIFMTISLLMLKKGSKDSSVPIDDISNNSKDFVMRDNEILQPLETNDKNENNVDDSVKESDSSDNNENMNNASPSAGEVSEKPSDDEKKSLEEKSENKSSDVIESKEEKPSKESKLKEEIEIVESEEEVEEEQEDVPVSEKEIELEEPLEEEQEEDIEVETEKYSVIDDDKEEPKPIKKEIVSIAPLSEIKIDVVYPEKGKDIAQDQDEEEIELL